MKRNIERSFYEKCVITLVIIIWWLFMPKMGYGSGGTGDILSHMVYMFCHAGFWHMTGNLFVLWIIKKKLYLIPSLIIAILASFLPAWSLYGDMGTTMGFSGVLFAIYGIKWGVYCRHRPSPLLRYDATWRFLTRALPFALIGIVIPHLNWCIHLYTMVAGYIYGRYLSHNQYLKRW